MVVGQARQLDAAGRQNLGKVGRPAEPVQLTLLASRAVILQHALQVNHAQVVGAEDVLHARKGPRVALILDGGIKAFGQLAAFLLAADDAVAHEGHGEGGWPEGRGADSRRLLRQRCRRQKAQQQGQAQYVK